MRAQVTWGRCCFRHLSAYDLQLRNAEKRSERWPRRGSSSPHPLRSRLVPIYFPKWSPGQLPRTLQHPIPDPSAATSTHASAPLLTPFPHCFPCTISEVFSSNFRRVSGSIKAMPKKDTELRVLFFQDETDPKPVDVATVDGRVPGAEGRTAEPGVEEPGATTKHTII
jgi:hypothetical protein